MEGMLKEYAAVGVHDICHSLIRRYMSPPAKGLDLAAGEGAFASRLIRDGFTLELNDRVSDKIRITGVPIYEVDLEKDFTESFINSPYDFCIAMEVIEHLRNPWDFLKGCFKLINKNGIILLTTPNITNKWSRLTFLRKGEYSNFSPETFISIGHITPIPYYFLRQMIKEADLSILSTSAGGEPFRFRNNLKGFLLHQCLSVLTKLMKPLDSIDLEGWVRILILGKK